MEKSHVVGDRGKRRWGSFKKWMRRLKRDWNDHGWGYNIYWSSVDKCWKDTLCECFNLVSKGALRFKDTPKNCSSGPGCGNSRKWYKGKLQCNEGELTLAERVVNMGDREFWSKRKPREGFWKVRQQCRACGYLLGMREVPYGKSRWYQSSMYPKLCEDCRKKGR